MNASHLPTPSSTRPHDRSMLRYLRGSGMRMAMPRPLLSALGDQLSATLGEAGAREFFNAAGYAWATREQQRFANCDTLSALADSLNAYWAESRWGWAHLEESERGLLIVHHAAPASDSGDNVPTLLAGFYDAVFKLLGADPDMALQVASVSEDGFEIHLHLTA